MYDERDLAKAGSAGAALLGRGAMVKVGILAAFALIIALFALAPAAKTNTVAAGCSIEVPGSGTDQPETDGPLHAQQIEYVKMFDRIAVENNLPGRATLVAIMTALQESQIRNLPGGHADSVGIFQQRPSTGWGSKQQLQTEEYATRAFFGVGPQDPPPPGLIDIDGWYTMPLTEAAQAVQVSAFPDAYARHEGTALKLAAEAGINLDRPGDPYGGRPSRPGATTGPSGAPILNPCTGPGDTGPIDGTWPEESCSVVPDPSNGRGCVTPRTAAWIMQARTALRGQGMSCWDAHAWNPTSDHPRGRACDLMTGRDARKNAAEKAKGDRIAAWTLSTARQTGVRYVIWYGRIWSASRGTWEKYSGGGVYDANDPNGGHFNHVHVSMY
ncbi:hypothetical protein GCM10009789_83120 [Kribbella sancticallisti]|uniref:ARB-07466-like C-terminal domain-containing protein n=1 Tax=Kribbella sancticallisti TaxID=460087 RepID=A0ABP4QSM6_9ACTN